MSRSCKTLYVGNLPGDIREREVERLFHKYGPVVHIDLNLPLRPPSYAFVEFEDARDAEDAIRGRDGYKFDGHCLRVELAHGGRGNSYSTDRHNSGSLGPRGGVSRAPDYRVMITGLPQSASWQDLEDHMFQAGDVCFSQVFHEGSEKTGIVDYTNSDDVRYAIKKLDGSEFRNTLSRSRIHVKEYDSSRSRSRSRGSSSSRSPSYSLGRSNGRSRSRSLSFSRSRSRSKSPKGKSSRCSRSRSKSASPRSSSGPKARPISRSPSRPRSPKQSKRVSKSPSPKGCCSARSRSRSKSPSWSRSRSLSKVKKSRHIW